MGYSRGRITVVKPSPSTSAYESNFDERTIDAGHPEPRFRPPDLRKDGEHRRHLLGRTGRHELVPVVTDWRPTEEGLGRLIRLEDQRLSPGMAMGSLVARRSRWGRDTPAA